MNIVIIGEYSGFAKNLNVGFSRLGHRTCVVSWGDGFKKIQQGEGAINVYISNYSLFGNNIKGSHRIRRLFSYLKLRKWLIQQQGQWDIALIINPAFVKCGGGITPYPTINDIQRLLKDKQNIFLSACGNDYIFNSYLPFRKKTGEYIINKYTVSLANDKQFFDNIITHVRGIIPVMADYAYAYRYFSQEYDYVVFPTIPLPFDTDSVSPSFCMSKKIVIMHGITRPEEKGSDYIINALNQIKVKFPNSVEVQIVRQLPLDEYLRIMSKTNIVIDQCYAWSYGMNTIEALSMGKIVLSGNEPENISEFGIDSCPVINICPDTNEIYEKLEYLINSTDKLEDLSAKSIKYSKELHECTIVANEYIKIFNQYYSHS